MQHNVGNAPIQLILLWYTTVNNGRDVRHASFHNDMDKLIGALKGQLGQADAPPASWLPPEDHRKIEEAEAPRRSEDESRPLFPPLAKLFPDAEPEKIESLERDPTLIRDDKLFFAGMWDVAGLDKARENVMKEIIALDDEAAEVARKRDLIYRKISEPGQKDEYEKLRARSKELEAKREVLHARLKELSDRRDSKSAKIRQRMEDERRASFKFPKKS